MSFLFPRLRNLSHLSFSKDLCSGPLKALLCFSAYASGPCCLSCRENLTQYLRWSFTRAQYWGTMTSLLTTLFLIRVRKPLVFLATRAHCQLLNNNFRFLSSGQLSILSQVCSIAQDCCNQMQKPALGLVEDNAIGLRLKSDSCLQAEKHFLPTWCPLQTY